MSDHADTIIQKQYRKGFLSMREYVRPMMMSEAFAPNEYIAACYTLVCAIPGDSYMEIDDGTASRWFGNNRWEPATNGNVRWGDLGIISADGNLHGNCGLATTSYDDVNQIGYEFNLDGTLKKETTIHSIQLGGDLGDRYYATWHSNNGTDYTHYGYAIKNANPNHS